MERKHSGKCKVVKMNSAIRRQTYIAKKRSHAYIKWTMGLKLGTVITGHRYRTFGPPDGDGRDVDWTTTELYRLQNNQVRIHAPDHGKTQECGFKRHTLPPTASACSVKTTS